jgi:hypothetical protein
MKALSMCGATDITINYSRNLSPLGNSPPSEGLGEVLLMKYPYILLHKKAEKRVKNAPFQHPCKSFIFK